MKKYIIALVIVVVVIVLFRRRQTATADPSSQQQSQTPVSPPPVPVAPVAPAAPTKESYIGCYLDDPARTMTWMNDGKMTTKEGCRAMAVAAGKKYYGLQFVQADGQIQCFTSNDINQIKRLGSANNCTSTGDRTFGGPYSNAVYELS